MNPTVLITGASRGIGHAAAELFAKEGYELYLTCLHSMDTLLQFQDFLEKNITFPATLFAVTWEMLMQ